jgi:hypothetical protein
MSLALDGELERGLSADALHIRLRALLGARRRRVSRAEAQGSLA